MSAPASPPLEVGYVARAHGLKGELGIRTFDPSSTSLLEAKQLVLRSREGEVRSYRILGVRQTPKELLVRLDGMPDRTRAEAAVGSTVLVDRDELPALEEDEHYQADLIGLRARSPQGEELGVVEEIWNTGDVPTLVIRKDGEELAVPLVEAFVTELDPAAGTLIVDPPEYVG
ncbi:MAG TPA: ribosome maturation factor RimM [Myxococcaceae bacterium]|nr:ribosome maturation factor RimM [Myxococcaceae bacterium]